jgi:tRNA guanosine-2'-O-methyltransferase
VFQEFLSPFSVTSEKWLNISELKSWQLEDYLKNMKSHGYKIIGAEQTAKSISFYDVKFPKKTVLLLG